MTRYDVQNTAYPGAGPYLGIAAETACLRTYLERMCVSRLADLECEHGSLPDDRVIRCDCWKAPKSKRKKKAA